MLLSVIIPTYNPDLKRLSQTLESLKNQTLDIKCWELIIIDNNSPICFKSKIDISWHPNVKITIEKSIGLTSARLAGFKIAKSDFILMVDDDNVLDSKYLKNSIEIMMQNSTLGAIGGKSIPMFEAPEPNYLKEFYSCLALRDLGEEISVARWEEKYPSCAPIGAGMVIRRKALNSYISKVEIGQSVISDRKGNSLSSGGDNDIVLEILKSGFYVGYFPKLLLNHIIPKNRTSVGYLSRLNFESSISWVLLLNSHGILPWRPINKNTLTLRYLKSYLKNKAWLNKSNYIKWKGSCGLFKGLSQLEYE